jgi:prefoldin alpha subunit
MNQGMKEAYMEYQMIEQHTKQMHHQLEAVAHQLMEMNSTILSLDEFSKVKAQKEVFVPINSGIFAKATIEDTGELLVNVGAGTVVTKDIPSTKALISGQIEDLKNVQKRLMAELEKLAGRAADIEKILEAAQ